MSETRRNKLYFGAKAKFFVFIAKLNSTSRLILSIAPTCQSLEICFKGTMSSHQNMIKWKLYQWFSQMNKKIYLSASISSSNKQNFEYLWNMQIANMQIFAYASTYANCILHRSDRTPAVFLHSGLQISQLLSFLIHLVWFISFCSTKWTWFERAIYELKIFFIKFVSNIHLVWYSGFWPRKWSLYKQRSNTLEFFSFNHSNYTLLDSAFSAQQNEVDLKSGLATLEIFLFNSFLVHLVRFSVFGSTKWTLFKRGIY